MKSKPVLLLSSVFVLTLAIAGVGRLISADQEGYTPLQKLFYLDRQEAVWIRPGLNLEILGVTIPDSRKPVVTFEITDEQGQPLDREGTFTPGAVNTSFIIAYIPGDSDQYVSYTTRPQTSPITGVTEVQASSDSGGRYASLGDGRYTYTFGTTLPFAYDRSRTHTIGIYADRDLTEHGLTRYVANGLYHFVPDGGVVQKVRDVVATETCNQCHNLLALHGGRRTEVGLCVLCHTPQTVDPDTGNTQDFNVLIHKIHMGENLPSVQAGKPYQVIGNRQSVHDYSTVLYPQDLRNCTSCHTKATQADKYKTEPSRAACGACHDDLDWRSGEKHAAGAQPDDRDCARCHWSRAASEYDASIPGAHIDPAKSGQLMRPKLEILSITGTGPGQKPVVQFRISDKNDEPIAPSDMGRLGLTLAGPTSDYSWYIQESATRAAFSNGVATYTFTGSLPSNAKGTYLVGAEGYLNAVLNPGTTKQQSYRDAIDNTTVLFAVTGSVTPRRMVVDQAKCNACHGKLQLHGNNRNDVQYCSTCHNPTMTDTARRPAAVSPSETVHFKTMIHRIHTGEELDYDFTVYGFGNTPHNYNEVRYPGDRRDCAACHVGNTYTLPVPSDSLPSETPRWFWSPTGPSASACLGCHDSLAAASHAFINTSMFGESCSVCHKESADFAVGRMHAR